MRDFALKRRGEGKMDEMDEINERTEQRGNRRIKCGYIIMMIYLLIYYILFSNRETEYWNKVVKNGRRREMKL
jgi:hypothetical protein